MDARSLKAYGVDPRYVTQEILDPVYRVDFWDEHCASDENRIDHAQSVQDVLAWAETNRRGRYVVIWVEYRDGDVTGLTRLHGWEPTDPDSPSYNDPYFSR